MKTYKYKVDGQEFNLEVLDVPILVEQGGLVPKYAHGPAEDAGMDLCASEEVVFRPFIPQVVKTNIRIELPPGYEAQVRPRGGLALTRGFTVINTPGTCDPAYRGVIGVIGVWYGREPDFISESGPCLIIPKGFRVAQLVVAKYVPVNFVQVSQLSETSRGEGAYASTGYEEL
jgi:dUTP pyrophosphatase